MKTHFTADGHQRWTSRREAEKRKAALAKSADEKKASGCFGKIRQWWRMQLQGLRMTAEEKEKSSPKILW